MCVAEDVRKQPLDEVDVFVAVEVPNERPAAPLEEYGRYSNDVLTPAFRVGLRTAGYDLRTPLEHGRTFRELARRCFPTCCGVEQRLVIAEVRNLFRRNWSSRSRCRHDGFVGMRAC